MTGASLNCIDTDSQVCNLMWSKNVNELVSTHGYSLMTAGRKTFSLFVNEGVAVMENDCVIETLCLWADITIACITSVMAIMMVDHGPEYWTRSRWHARSTSRPCSAARDVMSSSTPR